MAHQHRSSFKQGHKSFKSKHSSKGALKRLFKGKVERDVANNKALKTETKLQRRNKSKQLRNLKILESVYNRKLFEGSNGVAKVVTFIPLTQDVDLNKTINLLLDGQDLDEILQSTDFNQPSINNIFINQFKTNLKIITPNMSNFIDILDAAKISDFVIFNLSGTSEIEQKEGEQIIRALELQGISSYIGCIANLSEVHPKEKFQLDVKQSLESYFKHFFPNEKKIFNLEKKSDSLNVLRNLCQKLPRSINWRDNRGYLVAENVDYQDVNDEYCELMIQGTVRGVGFNANRLVHIPNLGDFQISKIEKVKSVKRVKQLSKNKKDDPLAVFEDEENLFESNEDRDTLDEFAPMEYYDDYNDLGDDDDEFQYDNLKSARFDEHGFLPRQEELQNIKKRLPKGTSEYQAKWYLDENVIDVNDDEELEGDEDDEEDDVMVMEEENDIVLNNTGPSVHFDDNDDVEEEEFMELSQEEEQRQLEEFRNMEMEDLEFPDELELNPAESAIERLKRYRGLKSLYNCYWNVDETDPNRPEEWKKLLRIGNYKYTRNKLLKEAVKTAQVVTGDFVKIYLSFPKNLLGKLVDPRSNVLAIYGLLPHEHKKAVVNFSLQRWEEYDKPVPSQEPIIVQYGIRRYTINPLYSNDTNTPNNVHKFEKFLHPDVQSIATCIAPVDFTQSPAIFFKPSTTESTGLELIGHGTFLNSDHTRVIAKRAILTGHPFRFHKNVLTVRYMFFRPEDVEWFKSIPLFTKSGRSGFIRESLGTHGYFKANFDAKLSAQDVVAMSLYRRKWPQNSHFWSAMD